MERIWIKDYPLRDLEDWVESIGERRFRARQLFRHLYLRGIDSWDACSDLSKSFRTQLEYATRLDALTITAREAAEDGTVKYLFTLSDGRRIESVLIPDPPRQTLCVSSQVGCALGCRFCLTGSLGFQRHLSTAEIVDQVCQVQRDRGGKGAVTNLVFMGMGEPLANLDAVLKALEILLDPNGAAFSHRRITVSTVGLVPALERLGRVSPVNLAISLHAPEDSLRSELMPVNRSYPLAQLLAACRAYPIPPRKRITFEYILLRGVNDDPARARQLVRLLEGIRAKVNLIPFNPHPDLPFTAPEEAAVLEFQAILKNANLTATIRKSRGADIRAACGQLAARYPGGAAGGAGC